jgi:hypothetical protein
MRTCEICNQRDAIGVIASVLGPSSHAVCRPCYRAGAEPWAAIVATATILDLDLCESWVRDVVDASIVAAGRTRADYDAAVAALAAKLAADVPNPNEG